MYLDPIYEGLDSIFVFMFAILEMFVILCKFLYLFVCIYLGMSLFEQEVATQDNQYMILFISFLWH